MFKLFSKLFYFLIFSTALFAMDDKPENPADKRELIIGIDETDKGKEEEVTRPSLILSEVCPSIIIKGDWRYLPDSFKIKVGSDYFGCPINRFKPSEDASKSIPLIVPFHNDSDSIHLSINKKLPTEYTNTGHLINKAEFYFGPFKQGGKFRVTKRSIRFDEDLELLKRPLSVEKDYKDKVCATRGKIEVSRKLLARTSEDLEQTYLDCDSLVSYQVRLAARDKRLGVIKGESFDIFEFEFTSNLCEAKPGKTLIKNSTNLGSKHPLLKNFNLFLSYPYHTISRRFKVEKEINICHGIKNPDTGFFDLSIGYEIIDLKGSDILGGEPFSGQLGIGVATCDKAITVELSLISLCFKEVEKMAKTPLKLENIGQDKTMTYIRLPYFYILQSKLWIAQQEAKTLEAFSKDPDSKINLLKITYHTKEIDPKESKDKA